MDNITRESLRIDQHAKNAISETAGANTITLQKRLLDGNVEIIMM